MPSMRAPYERPLRYAYILFRDTGLAEAIANKSGRTVTAEVSMVCREKHIYDSSMTLRVPPMRGMVVGESNMEVIPSIA
jgi:hypothetical protein